MEEEEVSNSSVHATIHGSSPHGLQNPHFTLPKKHRTVHQNHSPKSLVDRISNLPEAIIHHILTFLPIKDVIKTSLLAKRWEFLWTTVPALCFGSLIFEAPHKFADFVDKTLILYRSTKVSKFSVANFKFSKGFSDRLDLWVRFAVLHEAEDICLEFEHPTAQYVLPHCLYTTSSLKKLSLRYLNLLPARGFAWASLKILSITLAKLSDAIIIAILEGSPSLEFLKLQKCKGYSRINTVFGSSLKELVIDGHLDGGKRVTIKGPNLLSLSISGSDFQCKLDNVCSLMEANITFQPKPLGDYGFLWSQYVLIKDILRNLGDVGKLTVGTCCLQVLSISNMKGLPSPPLSCKIVALNTGVTKWELPGIANLLASAPNLQNLIIDMKPVCHDDKFCLDHKGDFYDTYDFVGEEFWDTEEEIELQHLRSIEIYGLDPCSFNLKLLLGLIKFLLKNSEALEKMVIHAKRETSSWSGETEQLRNFLRLTRLLLSFQRASPDAVVLFPDG